MAILNPCCCIDLQKGSKLVAFVDILLACIPVIIFLTSYESGTNSLQGKPFTDFNTGIWTVFIVFLTVDVGLSILLILGAKTRSTKHLKRWFYIRIATTSLTLIILIITACFEVSFTLIAFDIFHTLYRIYTLWVVYLFIGEIVYQQLFQSKKSPDFLSNQLPTPTTITITSNNNNDGDKPGQQLKKGSNTYETWDTPPDPNPPGVYGSVNNAYIP